MGAEIARLYNFNTDFLAGTPIDDRKVDEEINQLITSDNKKVVVKTTAPTDTTDGNSWVDTSIDPPLLKVRDATNSIWEIVARVLGKGADVASAAAVTLGDDGGFFDITGTTTITSITAKRAGTVVVLQFDGVLTVTDGSNLKLNGNFLTAAESVLLLISDGTNWFEVTRRPQVVDIGVRVKKSAVQSLTSGSTTAITFDQEDYDTDTMHDTSTNTARLTSTTAGKYLIWATGHFATNGTGRRIIAIRLNGTTVIAEVTAQPLAGEGVKPSIVTEYNLVGGGTPDYVELTAFQDSGGALDFGTDAKFGMRRVAG